MSLFQIRESFLIFFNVTEIKLNKGLMNFTKDKLKLQMESQMEQNHTSLTLEILRKKLY